MGGGAFEPCQPTRLGSTKQEDNANLWGIVDMGSNGIRFSITDLSPATARIVPTLYSYRNAISLYEAQYDNDGNQIPIPEDVQNSVIGAFLRFEIVCFDFGVPFKNIRIIATEATRKAINGRDFVDRIARETGWKIEILSQTDEGEIGAWGIASSSSVVRGLVMDLGGGSTQITWVMTKDGHMKTCSKGAFSFPYGAAALTQRLASIEKKSKSKKEEEAAKQALREEMKQNFLNAYHGLEVPAELVKEAKYAGGFTLYLSGGGFRGWGYLLLYQAQEHKSQYPISIINGFVARRKDFTDTKRLEKVAKQAKRIFRVSDRRRAQVPAVAFLVNVLAEIVPHGISEAQFCQGGVREGVLFETLPPDIRMQSPIEVATEPYARPLAPKLAELLHGALPKNGRSRSATVDTNDLDDGWDEIPSQGTVRKIPSSFTTHIVHAMANMLYVHADMMKELSSTAALYTTSSGYLADTHGTSHRTRALLALLLEARYEGDLPPREYSFREALRRLLSPAELWWINYLGAVAYVLSGVYPAGREGDLGACADDFDYEGDTTSPSPGANPKGSGNATSQRPHHKKPHLSLCAQFADNLGKSMDRSGLRLVFTLRMREHVKDDPMKVREALESRVKRVKKVGKKKNWVRTMVKENYFDSDHSEFDPLNDEDDDSADDDDAPGWGMKVEVEIKIECPKERERHDLEVVYQVR